MENSNGNTRNKSTTTSKNDETEERWNILRQQGKSNTSKTDKTTRGNKSNGTRERRKTKKISKEGITIEIK